jgi:hypothetical protein
MFSQTFRLLLDEGEQLDLHVLYDMEPYLDEIELVHKALKIGIAVLKRAAREKKKDPDFMTRTQRETRGSATVDHGLGISPSVESRSPRLPRVISDN